jgi:MarR family transcriptional regulator, organic hydroperoxide resistance regulator
MAVEDKEPLPVLIKQANRLIDNYVDRALKEQSIARSQYRVLYWVNLLGNPTQKKLLEKLNIKGSTLTIIVDSLVQKNYLARSEDKQDKRVRRLNMTDKGRALFDSIPDPAIACAEKIQSEFDKKEIASLKKDMRKIIKLLK